MTGSTPIAELEEIGRKAVSELTGIPDDGKSIRVRAAYFQDSTDDLAYDFTIRIRPQFVPDKLLAGLPLQLHQNLRDRLIDIGDEHIPYVTSVMLTGWEPQPIG